MSQNSVVKKDKRLREQYGKERLTSDSFQLGGNLEEGEEGEEGREGEKGSGGEGGFNQEEAANTLAEDRERERIEKDGLPAQAGKEGQDGGEGQEGQEGEEGAVAEKMTIPSEVSAFVVQWEFIFALAGPFFLFILLAEFIALRVFSMFKFSKWKKICTLGNFLLACFTTLIYFLLFMALMAALQETGGTTTGVWWWGTKTATKGIASSVWSGFTSFFGFGK